MMFVECKKKKKEKKKAVDFCMTRDRQCKPLLKSTIKTNLKTKKAIKMTTPRAVHLKPKFKERDKAL